RSDHAKVVGALPDVGENVADFDAALAVLLETEGAGQGAAGLALGLEAEAGGQGLAGVGCQRGLRVEGVDVAGAAIEEKVDHALGAAGEVGEARRQGVYRLADSRVGGARG